MEKEHVTEVFDSRQRVRTGRLIRINPRWGAREVKFNSNHDPKDGRFTVAEGGGAAGMNRPPKPRQAGKGDGTWGGGGFTGGGGGLTGGGSATGYYITHDEVRAYRRQHLGRDPYLTQPGDAVASIAAAHGLDVEQVRALNGAASGGGIKPGQVLALPAG